MITGTGRFMPVNIATILPIHNELESTKKFLVSYYDSIQQSSLKDHCSLIIVDDGSTDGSREWIAELYPDVRMLRGSGNLWWSGSINLALRHIENQSFTHFLLFNNDNIVQLNFFDVLAKAINEIGNDRIISSKVINIYPRQYVIYGGITFDRGKSRYIVNKDVDKAAVVNTAGGMGVLVPLSVIHKVGLFDDINFPQKSGDTDFYLRAEKMGAHVHYYPALIVYNDNSISGYTGNTSIQAIRCAYSFPKGYMNLKVDITLFFRHGNYFWSIYRIIKNNIIFLTIGIIRIIKMHLDHTHLLP